MNADPNTGVIVYVNGTPEQIGGTSLASPLALGSWARIETNHDNKLEFASPQFYRLYQGATATPPTPGFHDVILGDTGICPAAPGYDLATGLGSFDVAQLNAAIAKR